MKSLSALLLCSAALLTAAEFKTGQAARSVFGQMNFTRQDSATNQNNLGAATGVALAGDILIVVDGNRLNATPSNNRVLLYRNLYGENRLPAPDASIPADTGRCPVCGFIADTVLGQRDFNLNGINGTTATSSTGTPVGDINAISANGMRTPSGVASDGQRIAVADTENNRIVIWNSIPAAHYAPADVVLGQENFTKNVANWGGTITNPGPKGLRSPQGVWFHEGKLLVADSQNNRVLIWNNPTQNGQAADLVLGYPEFTSFVPNVINITLEPTPGNMLTPVAVSTDPSGRVYVSDLGHSRVLIWNSFPASNGQSADLVVGQKDMTSGGGNRVGDLCEPTGENDEQGNALYPRRCAKTLNFPRFALSDGTRLFIADAGNDRVLVYNSVPTNSGAAADVVLGQRDDKTVLGQETDILGNSDFNLDMVGTSALRTPSGLAWDGRNLFVTDPYNRRLVVFTPATPMVASGGVRNAASFQVFSLGTVTLGGTIRENDEVTIKVEDKEYTYKIVANDSLGNATTQLTAVINSGSGDANVIATANTSFNTVILTARKAGPEGDQIDYSVATKAAPNQNAAAIVASTDGSKLEGGEDAARIVEGSLITVVGENFTSKTESAPSDATELPKTLGGVELFIDGIKAPLLYVSPTQINSQMPWQVSDATSATLYVRRANDDGTVEVGSSVEVPLIRQNPGIFAEYGTDPRPAYAYHESSQATGAVLLSGGPKENDVVTVTIEDRPYAYTVKKDETLDQVRAALVPLINADPKVEAYLGGQFTYIRLRARESGAAGEGIKYSASVSASAGTTVSALSAALCCAATAGARITADNPAKPGQTIYVYATGLGLVNPTEAQNAAVTGKRYTYTGFNRANQYVDSIAGGKTASVMYAGLEPDTVGLYRVTLQLNPDLPTNPQTQLYIAQDVYTSNIVTFAVKNPSETTTP